MNSTYNTAFAERKRLKNPGYYYEVDRCCKFAVPENVRVLEVGCSTGRLLAALKPAYGLGIDVDEKLIEAAREIHKQKNELDFRVENVEQMNFGGIEPFDYIVLSDVLPLLKDIQKTFEKLREVCKPSTRLVITYHSNLWRPFLMLAALMGRRSAESDYNWLSTKDIQNLLNLSDFKEVTSTGRTLLPLRVPFVSWFFNRFLAKLSFFKIFCLTWRIVARPIGLNENIDQQPTVSIVIPTKNEKGNIEDAFLRTPVMGCRTELVFVDGHSDDGTTEEIKRCIEKYGHKWNGTLLLNQTGKGKGNAVREAFSECSGNILMILDSDLTMPPEELVKYYNAIVSNKAEFINGCRLVYPMEKKAMRFLNMIANHFFAVLFSWLLEQRVKDTLCGTKVLWKRDYEKIADNRAYFGDFDPFGDFDLLFGASKLNLKIIDMPIRYKERVYGDIKIDRWRHGLLLLKMSSVAFKKLKLS